MSNIEEIQWVGRENFHTLPPLTIASHPGDSPSDRDLQKEARVSSTSGEQRTRNNSTSALQAACWGFSNSGQNPTSISTTHPNWMLELR